MKRYLAALLAALAGHVAAYTAALASDPAPGRFNWTGLYIGVAAGANVHGGSSFTYTEAGNFEPADRPRPNDMANSLFAAGHIGFNQQIGQIVIGAEASILKGAFKGALLENPPPIGNDYNTTSKVGPIYAATGRIGFVPTPALLLYAKGGYAWSTLDFDASFYNKDGPGGTNGTKVAISNSYNMGGFVYGGGVEYALLKNVTIGVEYVRYDFRTSGVATLATTNSGILEEKVKADLLMDTIQARLNFKF